MSWEINPEWEALSDKPHLVPLCCMPDQYKPLNITNADIEFSKKYQAALDELIRKHQLAVNDLTEKQLAEAIRQAIACGDFERHICAANSTQLVIYIPHAREMYLLNKVRELEVRIRELEEELRIRDYDDRDLSSDLS